MGHLNNILKTNNLTNKYSNREGFPAFERDWKEEYLKMLLTNTVSQVFYEQQNTGSPFYDMLQTYRKEINADAKAFIIDVAPYRNGMVPTDDKQTFYFFGWSESIITAIALATQGYANLVDTVSQIEIVRRN